MGLHFMDFGIFMQRYKFSRENGDRRYRIRYVEHEDYFELAFTDVDGEINLTDFNKEAIYTEARISADKIDTVQEITNWKMEFLRDAIEEEEMVF